VTAINPQRPTDLGCESADNWQLPSTSTFTRPDTVHLLYNYNKLYNNKSSMQWRLSLRLRRKTTSYHRDNVNGVRLGHVTVTNNQLITDSVQVLSHRAAGLTTHTHQAGSVHSSQSNTLTTHRAVPHRDATQRAATA